MGVAIQEFDFASGKVLDPRRRQGLLFLSNPEDERAVVDGLRQKSYKMAAQARDVRAALGMVKKHKIGVFFLDADADGVDALGLLANIRKVFPDVNVVLVSATATKEGVADMLQAGAAGFLLKPVAADAVASVLARLD